MSEIEDQGPRIKTALWSITAFAAVFGALRIYCKARVKAIIGWDDTVLISAWLLTLIYTIIIHITIDMGIGRHLRDFEPSNVVPALRLVYVAEFIIIIGCSLSKTSFAITLLRTVTRVWQKVLVWYIIISMNLVMSLCAILYFAQCNPVDRLWDFSITRGSCWNPNFMMRFAMAAGGYSAGMDFLLAMLPWTFLMKLQMKKREKFGIAIAMSLGVFAGITAIVKTSYLPNIALQQDFTYYCADVLIWAGVETGVTIIATSIPFMRPLVRAMSSYGRSAGDSSMAFKSESVGHFRQLSSLNKMKRFSRLNEDLEMNRRGNDTHTTTNGSLSGTSANSQSPLSAIKKTHEITISYDEAPSTKPGPS